jgi:acetolactate synthase-1/2/3 large subunit
MERLHAEGVKHLFAVTGRGALFLSDAAAKLAGLEVICAHHEQAAGYSAVAYAQYSGAIGACLVSTGCAATNVLTAVLCAWQDEVPCIFISGQNVLNETTRFTGIKIRTFGQQEADIIPVVQSITKYSIMITNPNRVVYEIEKAIYLASNGRKGPVWIDVPLDIQSMRINPVELESFYPPEAPTLTPSVSDIDYLREVFAKSHRPVILVGNGLRSAGAIKSLTKFLENCPIPITYAGSAPDVYGTRNVLSIGSVGSMGCSRAGNFAIQNADLVLVLGNRLASTTTGPDYCKFARGATKIVVDIDPVEHSKTTIEIDRLIISDAKKFLDTAISSSLKINAEEWLEKCQHWKTIFPKCEHEHRNTRKVDLYYLAECLSDVLPAKSVFVSDSGFVEVILPTNMSFSSDQRCIHPASQGAMGFALPASIGASYASDAPVVVVVGDGSIMMNLQELQTIRHNNIPVKVFVINNNAYAIIRRRQTEMFRSRTIGTDSSNGLSCPDFEQVAACFGMSYSKIEDSKNLKFQLEEVIAMDGPILCEILGREDQEYIEIAHTRNKTKQLVRRPLEDQAPFLDRGIFLREMIIDPIDQ